MRLQIASDLHLEDFQARWPGFRLIEPDPTADALLLAGDIGEGELAADLFADWPVPVFAVMGNHEPYGHDLLALRERLRRRSGGAFTLLDRGAARVGPARILGATLWTDFSLHGDACAAMSWAGERRMDHKRIARGGERFAPQQALEEHREDRQWLADRLAEPFDGPTIVLTHHAPHAFSLEPPWREKPTAPAFASDCSDLLAQADLWVHGHVHANADYAHGGCRVLANPRGYSLDRRRERSEDGEERWAFAPDLDCPEALARWENPEFQRSLLVDLPALAARSSLAERRFGASL
jgi:predicted phosphodiesterase